MIKLAIVLSLRLGTLIHIKFLNNVFNLFNRKLEGEVIRLNGTTYYASDYLSFLILSPFYERKTFETVLNELKTLLTKKTRITLVDVGAHIGKYTIGLGKKFNSVTIVSIEPHPVNMNMLLKAVKANGLCNVIPIQVACAASDGYTKLWISRKSDHHSLLRSSQSFDYITVIKRSIDSLEEIRIQSVDLMKIDVEGAEFDCIKGAIKSIKKYKPIIFVEITTQNYYNISRILEVLGYSILKIEGNNYIARKMTDEAKNK